MKTKNKKSKRQSQAVDKFFDGIKADAKKSTVAYKKTTKSPQLNALEQEYAWERPACAPVTDPEPDCGEQCGFIMGAVFVVLSELILLAVGTLIWLVF